MADVTYKMCDEEENYCRLCTSSISIFPECPYCAFFYGWQDRDEIIKKCGIQATLAWKSHTGRGLLSESVAHGNFYEDVVFWLDKGADPDSLDYNECSALQNAMINGHFKIARLLIKRGADCSKFVDDDLLGYFMYIPEPEKNEEREKTIECIKKYDIRINIKG